MDPIFDLNKVKAKPYTTGRWAPVTIFVVHGWLEAASMLGNDWQILQGVHVLSVWQHLGSLSSEAAFSQHVMSWHPFVFASVIMRPMQFGLVN